MKINLKDPLILRFPKTYISTDIKVSELHIDGYNLNLGYVEQKSREIGTYIK